MTDVGAAYWSDLRRHGWDELWMNHPIVRERINRRVTGDPALWPIQWLATVVPDRVPFPSALNVGCGLGHLERSLVEHGLAAHVTGIDTSASAVEEARRAAGAVGLAGRMDFVVADAWRFLGECEPFDAVFFHASLHHFDRLSDLLGLVRRALKPRGILYLDEYVGPARDEWTWRHLLRWNLVYRGLPAAMRRTRVTRRPINREDPPADLFDRTVRELLEREERLLARGAPTFQAVVVAEPR
jgi:SAM-dependent methyltransferase